MSKDKRRDQQRGRKAVEKAGKPNISRDAVEDLEPPKEKADGVKGGRELSGFDSEIETAE